MNAIRIAALGGLCTLGLALTMPKAAAHSAGQTLSDADKVAVFKAAGAVQRKGLWLICRDEPNPSGATIETVRDLNGDGRPEAVVSEGGTFCYGRAEAGYALLSKQLTGSWRVMTGGSGIPAFLKSRGSGKWPDIPDRVARGFAFRCSDGTAKEYALNRFEYEGKRCKPQR